ncbi:hypothetical protein [Streptomyces sp. NPDC050263]|uniref:hypothetical protein n=1 Tax=Streptomyces sp. NPDC050263 TaxID=3155037 RepID=UPI00342EFE54
MTADQPPQPPSASATPARSRWGSSGEILEVEHAPGTVTINSEVSAYVGDTDGDEIECGRNRPQRAESTGPAALFRLRLP